MRVFERALFKTLHKAAAKVLGGGNFSFSFAGTKFLNAKDAKSLFKENVFYEGDKCQIDIPPLARGISCFFEKKGNSLLERVFLDKKSLLIDGPFSLRLLKEGGARLFEAEGTLLIQKNGFKFLLSPEFKSSLNLLTPFRKIGKAAASNLAVPSSWRSFTYGDFGLLMLPKWARLKDHCDKDKTISPALNIPQVPFMQSWAKEFGLKTNQQLFDKKLHEVQKEVILLYGPGAPDGFICAPSDLVILRKLVIPKLQSNSPKNLYISRQGRRKPLNQNVVERFLNSKGFTIVEDKPRGIFEQAEMYFNAAIIAAPHGASLANLAFARAGTKLFEILPGNYPSETYRRFSAMNNLNYSCMFCGSLERYKDAAVEQDYEVDIHLLNSAIENVLKAS